MSTPKRFHRVRAVLDRRQPDLTVLMEDIQIPRNFAALLRTCDAVGVLEAHAVWRPGRQLKISRPASGGTRKWVPVRKHPDLDGAVARLRERGFRILAAHTDSPCLKLKPNAPAPMANYSQWGVEVYGGVLFNSWLDRDLGLFA